MIAYFLQVRAVRGRTAASTQSQARCAILFLYKHVLKIDTLKDLAAVRAKRPLCLPTILSFEEVVAVINAMSGVFQLIAKRL